MSIRRISILVIALGALSGCATAKYQCPTPSGVACMSAKEVYNLTDAPGKEGMDAAANAYTDKTPAKHGRHQTESPAPPASARTTASVPLPKAGDVVPIREQSQVMRVWIAPYEDTDGNLVMVTRIYTDMEDKRWSVGAPAQEESHNFYPMQIDPSAPAPAPPAVQPGMQTAVPGTDNAPSG